MNESTRTVTYVGVAAVSVALAFFMAPTTPKPPDDFAEVGQPFYKDFAATDAKSLTVVSYNEDSTRSKVFNVELKDNKWVIGSHRNYPADGKDRLAKTATSVIGIKKEQFITKDPEQYAALQVIDPLDEDAKKIKGRGQHITLKDGAGQVLADYIIGKRVPDRDSFYYVRNPNEKSVYAAKLNVDLSTKFADWIEADLLKLQGENLNEVVINKHSLDKKRGRLTGRETNVLKRAKSTDPWTLEGLNEAKEEVNQDEVRTMSTALSDLKILGVREKPEGLSADLKTDKGIALDTITQSNLASKGFYFTQDGQLLSDQGEMIAITDGGVAYTLRFGEVFIGSELDMETGLEADQRKQEEKDGKKDKADEKGSNKSRYVFITAHFDPQGLGPKPEPPGAAKAAEPAEEKKPEDAKPEEKPAEGKPAPEKPAEEKAEEEKPADKKPAEDKPAEDKPAEDKPAEDKPAEDKPAEDKPAEDKPAEEKKPEAKPEGEGEKNGCQDEAEKKPEAPATEKKSENPPAVDPFETDPKKPAAAAGKAAPKGPTPEEAAKAEALEATKKYEQDLKAYNEKVEKGQKKVKELNDRFADWYYVISEDNFLKLRLSRASLVKEKTKPEAKPGVGIPGQENPGANPADAEKPADSPKADAEKPAAKPDAEKKPEAKSEDEKPEEKKPEEKPAEEKKAEEKKPEEKKDEEKPAEKPAAEPTPGDKKPDESKPEEKKAEETKPEEKKPEA